MAAVHFVCTARRTHDALLQPIWLGQYILVTARNIGCSGRLRVPWRRLRVAPYWIRLDTAHISKLHRAYSLSLRDWSLTGFCVGRQKTTVMHAIHADAAAATGRLIDLRLKGPFIATKGLCQIRPMNIGSP